MENYQKYDLQTLKRVIRLADPFKSLFYGCLILGLIMAPVTAFRPYLIKVIVDDNIWQQDLEGLQLNAMFYIGLTLLAFILRYLFIYYTAILGQAVIRDFRAKVFKYFTRLNLSFFDTTPIGTNVTRTINDIEAVNKIFKQGSLTIIADILSVFMILMMMFYTSWRLTMIFLITVPIMMIASYVFKEKVKIAYEKVRTQISEMNAFLQERITGMRVIQIFNAEESEMKKFNSINGKYRQANLDSILYYAVFFPVVELINALALALLIYLGTRGIWNGTISVGAIVAFPIFLSRIFRPIRMLADKFNELQMGLVAAGKVFKVLDNPSVIPDDGTYEPTKLEGEVVFENVEFAYDEGNDVIRDISFTLNRGETLAIVGSTGSGKTTIINLLNRFYETQRGSIKIDGRDIKDYKLHALRNRISIVLQDVFLFNGTVMENITLRDDKISRETVLHAAQQIGTHTYIEDLPDQYEFMITERGSNLSMGQRQLISFVRALVFDPDILILDEATSSVDTETEATIQYAIEKLIDKRTSIIIAHRLSTIRHADQILVMENGKIAEIGTHSELLQNVDGKYKELYELQFSDELVA